MPHSAEVVAFLLILILASALNAQPTSLSLPAPAIPIPTGNFGIGRAGFEWTDFSRTADNAERNSKETATLMVYLWYPTPAPKTSIEGILLPGAKEIDASAELVPGFKAGPIFGGNWSAIVAGTIKSHAEEDAPLAETERKFPVVIFSPGAFGSSFEYTASIEDLVSHGYVVATIEHSYETFAVFFPGGKVRALPFQKIRQNYLAPPNSAPELAQERLDSWNRHRVDSRSADISFVLDKLSEFNKSAKTKFYKRLDLSHAGAIGHSRGGWAAIVACRRDKRLRACVNEDGSAGGEGLDYPGAALPTQPILYIEIPKTVEVSKDWPQLSKLHLTPEQWLQQWHEKVSRELTTFPSGGYFAVLNLDGMEHYSFSDRRLLQAERLGDSAKIEIEKRNLEACERVTRTFLDRFLKDQKQSVLVSNTELTVQQFSGAR